MALAAQGIGVSERTIWRWVALAELPEDTRPAPSVAAFQLLTRPDR